jgi:hypothetical protein
MLRFLISGAVYLLGVAIVLVMKPSYMFTPDGHWKEFGIGKPQDKYTPFPFWLFCLLWAVLSYIIVFFVYDRILISKESKEVSDSSSYQETYDDSDLFYDPSIKTNTQKLKKGYYMLNKKATRMSGVPKYVYLGEEE